MSVQSISFVPLMVRPSSRCLSACLSIRLLATNAGGRSSGDFFAVNLQKLSTHPRGAYGAHLPLNRRCPGLKVVLAKGVHVIAVRGGVDGQEIAAASLSVEQDHRQVAPLQKSHGIALCAS